MKPGIIWTLSLIFLLDACTGNPVKTRGTLPPAMGSGLPESGPIPVETARRFIGFFRQDSMFLKEPRMLKEVWINAGLIKYYAAKMDSNPNLDGLRMYVEEYDTIVPNHEADSEWFSAFPSGTLSVVFTATVPALDSTTGMPYHRDYFSGSPATEKTKGVIPAVYNYNNPCPPDTVDCKGDDLYPGSSG